MTLAATGKGPVAGGFWELGWYLFENWGDLDVGDALFAFFSGVVGGRLYRNYRIVDGKALFDFLVENWLLTEGITRLLQFLRQVNNMGACGEGSDWSDHYGNTFSPPGRAIPRPGAGAGWVATDRW